MSELTKMQDIRFDCPWLIECARLTHTKSGYDFQCQEKNARRQKINNLLNRIAKDYPMDGEDHQMILAAIDGQAYICEQQLPDQKEARRTSKLTLYAITDSIMNDDMTYEQQEECSRLMQFISEMPSSFSVYHTGRDVYQLMQAYARVCSLMPSCIEQRLFFKIQCDQPEPATNDPINTNTGSEDYMALFSVLLSRLCSNGGLTQAKIRQAYEHADKIMSLCPENQFYLSDVFAFEGNIQLLADTIDEISRKVPKVYICISMICAVNGYPCNADVIADLPAAITDKLIEKYMKTRSVEEAVRIENLVVCLYPVLTLSSETMTLVKDYMASDAGRAIDRERKIRTVFLDSILKLQYNLSKAALNDQDLCEALLIDAVSEDAAFDRPAMAWLRQKVSVQQVNEALTSQGYIDEDIAVRLFYLQIPCCPGKGKLRPLNDKEYKRLIRNHDRAVQALTELFDLEWEPEESLMDSAIYRKAVRQDKKMQIRKLRADFRSSVFTSFRLLGQLIMLHLD